MDILNRAGRLYINGSIHVALAVLAMVRVTQLLIGAGFNPAIAAFSFCSAVAGYNFVKYNTTAFSCRLNPEKRMIAAISLIAGLVAVASLFFLQVASLMVIAVMGLLTFIYTVPIRGRNVRSWRGVKVYIVAVCWTGVTVLIPALEAGATVDGEMYVLMVQRFLLIVILLLIFDIVDLRRDEPELGTIPQQLGTRSTKYLGFILLTIFALLEIPKSHIAFERVATMAILIGTTAIFLAMASENRHRNYSVLWAESIPLLWWATMEILWV